MKLRTKITMMIAAMLLLWGLSFLAVRYGRYGNRDVSFLACAIPGLLIPFLFIPALLQRRLAHRRWYYFALGVWAAVTIPSVMFAFNRAAGLGNKAMYAYMGCGVLALIMFLVLWLKNMGRQSA